MSDLGIVDARHGHRPPQHKHGRGLIAALVALAIIVGGGFFAYVKGVDLIQDALSGPEDYSGDGRGSVVVEVKEGDTATDIGTTLHSRDVVASVAAFTDVAEDEPAALTIQVGFYTLRKEMSAQSALDLLLDPESRLENLLTIPEGLRESEILDRVVDGAGFSRSQVERAASRTAELGLPAYADGDLEGFLFPSTYDVTPGLNAAGVLSLMLDQFVVEAEEIGVEQVAGGLGLTPAELVTVASLVQAESGGADMPKVAAVIYNRLAEGMPLQLDSTLHYADGSRGDVVASEELRRIDSPYNTYKYAGLPPGPINSPGADALEAAANPADIDSRYFVTVNLATGETLFADTFREHLRNVEKYDEYCQTSDEC